MKILFFIDGLNGGGKERRLIELMKALIINTETKCELALMDSSVHYKEVFDLNINIHYLIRKTKKDFRVVQKLYRLCKEIKPDILHCWDGMTAIYSVPVCKALGIPLVNGMVTNAPQEPTLFNANYRRAKLTFPFSAHIVGNSQSGNLAYKASSKKSSVIYNGFNFARTENLTDTVIIRDQTEIKTQFVVGMVASFSKSKDYKTYFLAAREVLNVRNDVTFLAIGTGTDSNKAKELIAGDYQKYFRLLGKISDVESYVNVMDICVLSTFTEGISNSILEYMALGKPVIATSGGGTNEIIEDTKTGFLIDAESPDQLSEKIMLLLDDKNLRNVQGNEGQKRIREFFSIDSMRDKYVSIYKSLIQEQ